jgi:predicted RNA binding protein YcfA (HicA-like mRNA interferase family)
LLLPELPVISGREARRAFERLGWVFNRQHGSHIIMTKPGSLVTLSIPDHRELAPGTLRKLIRLSGATVEQFARLLRDS